MRLSTRTAFASGLLLAASACGGSVVFEEGGTGGDGGAGATTSTATASSSDGGAPNTTSGSPTTSGEPTTASGVPDGVTVGPSVAVTTVGVTTGSVTTGGQGGVCGVGVSLFDGSADACLANTCCEAFDQCTRGGQDVAGCQSCLDGNGGDCGQALDCARNSGCLPSGVECPSGLTTNDPSFDTCLGENCCFDAQFCTNGGQDVQSCIDCFQQGGGPRCQPLLGCIERFGCQNGGQGICDSGLTTGDGATDQCLSDACCEPLVACTQGGADPQACSDCINEGGGPLCDEAAACIQRSGCF